MFYHAVAARAFLVLALIGAGTFLEALTPTVVLPAT